MKLDRARAFGCYPTPRPIRAIRLLYCKEMQRAASNTTPDSETRRDSRKPGPEGILAP